MWRVNVESNMRHANRMVEQFAVIGCCASHRLRKAYSANPAHGLHHVTETHLSGAGHQGPVDRAR